MIYAFAASVLFGLVTGGYAVHQFDAGEIERLKSAIELGNIEAANTLKIAQERVKSADEKAAQLNQQIEVSHAQAVETANALTDRVAAAGRVYAGRQNCSNPMPRGDSAGAAETSAERTDFPARLAEIVRRADETAVYAQSCWSFVSANCGLANVGPSER